MRNIIGAVSGAVAGAVVDITGATNGTGTVKSLVMSVGWGDWTMTQ